MRTLFLIILFGLFADMSYSQSKTSVSDVRNIYDEKGDYYYDKKEFKKAIVYYNMAFKMDANNYYSVLRKAEAYTTLELNDQAAECYRILFETNLQIPNEYRLQYALLLLKNKDIKGYEKWMSKYNDLVNSEIKDYVSSTEVRAKMYKDTSFVIVENESILNTPESEICPAVFKDKVVFSSTRKSLSGTAGSGQYNLYASTYLGNGQLGRLNQFNTSLNSGMNEFSVMFSEKINKFSFTQSNSLRTNLKTYFATIPANINDAVETSEFKIDGFTNIGHVAMNSSGTKMYFVSEAPGGSGGLDIYFSEFSAGKWSKPKNLGANINTAKDEMYPFVLNDTVLYFSSNGHGSGLGGFDLYSVNLNRENSNPKNLGNKVNSKYDDYSLTFTPDGLTGFFCSNRPGGFGKEDIYRLHLLDIKVKHAAYKFKRKTFMEDKKINLYLSNGDEYNIASQDNMGFTFGFQPGEAYKMVIQHENPEASNIINNSRMTADQRKREFLNPSPIERSEIRLETGMKYDFTAGMKPISADFKKALEDMSKQYQNTGSNTIDLTALAKELQLREGEIYTIRFVKDDGQYSDVKTKEGSNLFMNNQTVAVEGRSFFIVLPLDIQANFNIQTDIDKFKETFNPKKVGAVKVDATPVLKGETLMEFEGFPILVNTESFADASKKKISATELTIIPGSMYMLTLAKTNPGPDDMEVVIPLTKGVKYNLGTDALSQSDYNKALSQLSAQGGSKKSDEELIDIQVLSKELNVMSDKNIVFSLMPVPQVGAQVPGAGNILTTLSVDGRKFYVTNMQKLEVELKLDKSKKMNIQTDLAFVKENFDASTIAINVDTTSFNKNLAQKKTAEITDPVFDVIVVNFNLNEYALRPDAKNIVNDKVIQVLKGDSRLYVTIKGYTDALGDAAYNQKLSQNRAQAVKDYLSGNGIGESRIRTFSYGASMALKEGEKWENLSEEELQKHRKVEIVIYLPK